MFGLGHDLIQFLLIEHQHFIFVILSCDEKVFGMNCVPAEHF
jgi:hypothetical protein